MQIINSYIGVIGSGKDYRCSLDKDTGFIQINFKDSLIKLCEDIVDYKIDNYEEFKKNIVGFTGSSVDNYKLLKQYPNLITGRKLLQKIGTEVVRKIDENYWVNSLKSSLDANKKYNICIGDARFKNEFKFLLKLKNDTEIKREVNFYFCNYKSERYDSTSNHESEKIYQKMLILADKYNLKDGDLINNEIISELLK